MATYNADLNVSGTLTVPSGIFSDSVTVSGASVLTSESVVGGGGSALTVKEIDGSPSVANVDTIVVSDGTLTDDGGGQVTITTGGTSGGGAASGDFSGAWVILSGTTFNVPNSTVKFLPFDHAIYDTDNWFTAVSGEALKVPAGKGITHVQAKAQVDWESSGANGNFTLIIRKNYENIDNVVIRAEQEVNAADLQQQIASPPLPVVDGDELQLLVYQNSGVSIDIDNTPTTDLFRTWFSIEDITPRGSTSSGTGGGELTTSGSWYNPHVKPVNAHPKSDWFDDNSGQVFIDSLPSGTHYIDTTKWTLWDVDAVSGTNNGSTQTSVTGDDNGTLTFDTNNMLVHHDASTNEGWVGWYQDAPSGSFTITARVGIDATFNNNSDFKAGIFIADDLAGSPSTSDLISCSLNGVISQTSETDYSQIQAALWTDYNSISTNGATVASPFPGNSAWVRIDYNSSSTRVEAVISEDGINWRELFRFATISFTPSHIGIGMQVGIGGATAGSFEFFSVYPGVSRGRPAGHGRLLPTITDAVTGGGGGGGGSGDGTITSINTDAVGPAVTITGVGNISTTTVGNVITVSGVDTVDLRSKNYSGALVSRESGSTQAISGNTTVTWSDERIDTDGFFDSGDNTRLTIPAGLGIKKIRLTALARIVPSDTPTTTEYITSQIYKNGTNLPDDPRIVYRHPHIFANGIDVSLPYITPALTVVDGDYFELIIATNVGGSPVVSNIRSWFEIEVVERDSPLALTEFTAVSGTFTDSLTVSGVPVNIGASGGGSALTVKEGDGDPLVANVDTIVVTNGTLTDDGGGQVTIDTGGSTIGGIPTTASGAYWSAFAPPEYPSPFDDEFDTFTDDSIGQTPLDSPSDAWTAWSPASNGPFMRNAFGEGIEAAGFGFSHLGAATPTWQGYIRPLGEMVATTSGGQSYWIDTHVSMAERDTIRGLGGIILGGDLISSPTTEKFIYIALENNVAATVENTSQSQIRYASNGVDYNDALSTNTVYTDASGPNTTSMHLRLMYDALNNGYSMSYSTDGSAFSIASSTVIASGSLNFTPSVVGLVGRAEDTFGGWLTRFSHFRFRKANDRESGVSQITLNRTPVNGRQIYTNPVAAIPSDLIAASGTFSDSLTISGVPVSTGTGGGGASTLQEAYDGGDGVITTTAGKPLSIVGDEYDGNVDFKVTGSGQFTESLQVGSGTTFITGEMIETPSLFVDGNPLSASTVSTPQAVTTSGVIGKKLGMTHSPVALWLFENDLIDSSGNGLDLTKRAGPELYMSNHGLRCIKFDGVAHFAHTTTGTALEITGDITIELLLSVDQITTQGYLLSYSSDSSGSAANNVLYSLNYTVGNETLAALHHSGSETQHNFDSEAAGIDALHHLVMVRKNGDYTIYMDGMKIGDSSADFPDAASGTSSFFQLGALRAGFIWTGSIACVKVIDSALTADQVYAEFESTWATSEIEFPNVASNNSPFQTLDTSLAPLALYTLDGTITDTAGGTSPTLTVDAGTELYSSAGQPGIQMAYFDGSTQYSAPDAATRLLGDMTAECFIYVPTVPVSISAVILNCQGTSGGGETDNAIYNWVLQTTGEIRWNQQNGNQTSSAYDFSGVRMPIGETVHMAVTRQSDVLRLYINGILMDISPAQTTPTGGSDSDFHISGNRANTNRLQVGTRLGSVKIFDRALTQAEIKSESDRLFGMSAFSAGGQVVTAVSGTFSQSLTVSGVPVDITGGGGGGGAALTVKEADGVPTVANVDTIVVTNGTLTDDGSGQVTLDTGGSGGSIPSNSEFSGAVVTTTTGITVPTSPGFVYIPWDEVIFDETGWRSSDVNELVVPSGVTHVQAELALRWTGSTAGYRNIQIHLNENNVGQLKEDTISSSVTTMFHQVSTPPLKVAPGDVFTARAVQNTGGNLDLLEDTVDRVYFSVTALNRGLSDYITAVSGTFADSLTVSGVPVDITGGGGGGGAALTVKEADGVPTVANVDTIVVTNGTLTDDGSGQVTISTGGSGGGSGGLGQVAASGTIWMPEVAPAVGTQYDDEFVQGTTVSGVESIWTAWDPGTNIHTMSNDEQGLYLRNSNNTGQWMGIFQDVPPDGATGRWVAWTYVSMSAASDLTSGYRKIGFGLFNDAAGAPSTTDFQFLGLTSSPGQDWAIERGEYTSYTDTTPSPADYDKATLNGVHLNGVFLRVIKTNDGIADHSMELAYSFDGVGWKSMTSDDPGFDVAHIGLICVNGAGTTLYRYSSKFFRIDNRYNGASMRVQTHRGNFLDPTGSGVGGGSSFDPSSDQTISGEWDFTNSLTVSGVPVITTLVDTTVSGIIGKKLGTTHDPVALYLFDDNLSDSSGNGLDLTMNTGNERYTSINGLRAMKLSGAASARHNVTGTALEITGDVTVQALLLKDNQTSTNYAVAYGVSGDSLATNTLYSIRYLASSEQLAWFQEFGSGGTDQQISADGAGTSALHLVTGVRSGSLVTLYIDGIEVGSDTLTVPTGGTSSKLNIGDFDGGSEFSGAMACVKIIDSALTAEQVYAEYQSLWADAPSSSSGGSSIDESQVALLSQVFGS